MSTICTLIRSNGGVDLASEVCLRIVEEVIRDDPTAISALMRLSKSFNALLKTYEQSVTKTISKNNTLLAYVNAKKRTVLSSRVPPGDATVDSLTYEWWWEMSSRSSILDFLINHEISEMTGISDGWPTLEVPKEELLLRAAEFKKRGFLLMYQLADCTAGYKGNHDIRVQQHSFLESLSAAELATLGCLVEVVGQGFFTLTKKALIETPLINRVHATEPSSNPNSTSELSTPSEVPWNDLSNDNWIRECMCVFEDRLQRFGPYFAYSYVAGSRVKRQRTDMWARKELQQGLDDMSAFELGRTMAYASLQSVVWRVFCRKVDCSLQASWHVAREIVESEMAEYKIKA